jgi:hypothetical protein
MAVGRNVTLCLESIYTNGWRGVKLSDADRGAAFVKTTADKTAGDQAANERREET